MVKAWIVAGVIASSLACGQAEAGSKLGAVLGGAAVGVVGGAILGSALSAHAQPAPAYVAAPPPPPPGETVVYEAAPRRVVVQESPYDSQASRLHMRCDDGDRHACIRFGVLIGQHRERVAQWRRTHPDFFSYED